MIGDDLKYKSWFKRWSKNNFLDNGYKEKPMFSHYRIKKLKDIKKII